MVLLRVIDNRRTSSLGCAQLLIRNSRSEISLRFVQDEPMDNKDVEKQLHELNKNESQLMEIFWDCLSSEENKALSEEQRLVFRHLWMNHKASREALKRMIGE